MHLPSDSVWLIDYIRAGKYLNALSAVNHHFCSVDESSLITGQIETHVRDIVGLGQAAKWYISNEFLTVLWRVLHPGEHGKQTSTREERSHTIDSNVVRAIFRRKTLGCLWKNGSMVCLAASIQDSTHIGDCAL